MAASDSVAYIVWLLILYTLSAMLFELFKEYGVATLKFRGVCVDD